MERNLLETKPKQAINLQSNLLSETKVVKFLNSKTNKRKFLLIYPNTIAIPIWYE